MTDLDMLAARRYEVQISPVEERYFAEIRELSLITSGASPEQALEALERAKQDLFETYCAAGKADEVPAPGASSGAASNGLRGFILRSAVVALVMVVIVFSIEIVLTRSVTGLPTRIITGSVSAIDEIGQAVQWVSEERQREVGRSLQALLSSLEPMLDEIRPSIQRLVGTDPLASAPRDAANSGQ